MWKRVIDFFEGINDGLFEEVVIGGTEVEGTDDDEIDDRMGVRVGVGIDVKEVDCGFMFVWLYTGVRVLFGDMLGCFDINDGAVWLILLLLLFEG